MLQSVSISRKHPFLRPPATPTGALFDEIRDQAPQSLGPLFAQPALVLHDALLSWSRIQIITFY